MHYDTKSFLAGLFGSGTPARCRSQDLPELQPKPSDVAEIGTATPADGRPQDLPELQPKPSGPAEIPTATPAGGRPQDLPDLQPKPSDLAEIPTATPAVAAATKQPKPSSPAAIPTATPAVAARVQLDDHPLEPARIPSATPAVAARIQVDDHPREPARIPTATPAGCPVCGSMRTICGTLSVWCRDCADAGRETCLGPIPAAGDDGDADADKWLDLADGDGRRCLVRSELAGLEIIDAEACPGCGGLERWQDAAGGWHCSTCSPVPGRGEQLRQRAAELHARATRADGPTWPIAGADVALQLTPDDLPPVPWHVEKLSCYDNARLLNELRIDLAVIGKGGPNHRSGRLGRDIQRLLRVAQRHGATQPERADGAQALPSAEWPAALADFCLLLAPDDLPSVPFKLDAATTVMDRRKYLQDLQAEIRNGPSGPRARRGILQDELQRLQVALGLSAKKPCEISTLASAEGQP